MVQGEAPMMSDANRSLHELTEALESIPSIFAQIVCLTEKLPFTSELTAGMTEPALDELRSELFRRWLEFDLRAKEVDLACYLSVLGRDISQVRVRRLLLGLCRSIVPELASLNEMHLFLGEISAVLSSLAHDARDQW